MIPAVDIAGDRLKSLLDLVTGIEQGLRAFGRRNRSLRDFWQWRTNPTDSAKPDPARWLATIVLGRARGQGRAIL